MFRMHSLIRKGEEEGEEWEECRERRRGRSGGKGGGGGVEGKEEGVDVMGRKGDITLLKAHTL